MDVTEVKLVVCNLSILLNKRTICRIVKIKDGKDTYKTVLIVFSARR